jgi:glycerol-3-phosphate dehydrogenase
MYDVCIIGAGVTGSSIARELSKYDLKTIVVERGLDVCEGTSKANSGIVHAGFDAEPGTLKAKLNREGNERMEQLSKDLDFSFKRNGSMVICCEESGMDTLKKLMSNGEKNGVKDMKIISGDEARAKEPNLSKNVIAALDVPMGGIVCPFELTIALAENACVNGVEFAFDNEVKDIKRSTGCYKVITSKREIEAKIVINAAGVYADRIHSMVSTVPMKITARRGQYCLYDKQTGKMVSRTIFQLPSKLGKGVLFTPTVHGNLLVGPTAEDIDDKEGTNTTAEGMNYARMKASESVENMPAGRMMITSFSGLRAHEEGDDFIIREAEDAENFIDAAGIESPGLSCAPVIGEYVANIVIPKLNPKKKEDFIAKREGIKHINSLPVEERERLIKENSAYSVIVCRCEMITEGEILDAIHRPLGARTLDGIKRRTRAGMGRCQAGFCTPRTMELISAELGIPMEEILKSGRDSHVL